VERRLDRLLDYESVVELLRGRGEGAEAILARPAEVLRFAEVLRGLLRLKVPVCDIQGIAGRFHAQRQAGQEAATILHALAMAHGSVAAGGSTGNVGGGAPA
jgi:hypothetical protein